MLNTINVKSNFELLTCTKATTNSTDLMKTYTKRLFNCYPPPPTTHTHNDRKYNLNIVTLGDILLCFAGAEKKTSKRHVHNL